MSLHTHKARTRPGVADVMFLILIGAVATGLVMAALSGSGPVWKSTRGVVDSARFYEPASTALAEAQLVRLAYHYEVNGIRYEGLWDGDWPRSYSPNALADGDLAALTQAGYSLNVWYNPESPAESGLHGEGSWSDVVWRRMLLGAALVLWVWALRAYPRLKGRMGARMLAYVSS